MSWRSFLQRDQTTMARWGRHAGTERHPRTAFRRALEHENLLVAQAAAREIGRVSLSEALELTILIARNAARPSHRGRTVLQPWTGEPHRWRHGLGHPSFHGQRSGHQPPVLDQLP
jgi:hypothetical protein